jgi:hypothetical protein
MRHPLAQLSHAVFLCITLDLSLRLHMCMPHWIVTLRSYKPSHTLAHNRSEAKSAKLTSSLLQQPHQIKTCAKKEEEEEEEEEEEVI